MTGLVAIATSRSQEGGARDCARRPWGRANKMARVFSFRLTCVMAYLTVWRRRLLIVVVEILAGRHSDNNLKILILLWLAIFNYIFKKYFNFIIFYIYFFEN